MANDRRFDTGNFAVFFGHVIHHHQDIVVALEYVEVRSCTVILRFFFFSLFMCVCACVCEVRSSGNLTYCIIFCFFFVFWRRSG